MKKHRWTLFFIITLILLSILFYGVHFLLFRDPHHIFIYLVGDIAFLPFEVLIVSFILHRLLEHREKKNRIQKINMVVGAFFSEAGTRLLRFLSHADPDVEKLRRKLNPDGKFSESDLKNLEKEMKKKNYRVLSPHRISMSELRDFLKKERSFFMGLLENPNLLEHETFTDMLMALFHLTEELVNRSNLENPPQKDLEHLAGDCERVYGLLICEWVLYLKHLQSNYPYFYSYALRTNPFNPEPKVEIS